VPRDLSRLAQLKSLGKPDLAPAFSLGYRFGGEALGPATDQGRLVKKTKVRVVTGWGGVM
jgi:hypothetical protein